jgi:UDP-apiose/xylose synthase
MTSKCEIAVIGCGGFVGSHLVEKLLSQGAYHIFGINESAAKSFHFLQNSDFDFTAVKNLGVKKLEQVVTRCDAVINLAALSNPAQYIKMPLQVMERNFREPLKVVELCVKLKKRLIHCSSSEVYGMTLQGLAGKALAHPDSKKHYLLKEEISPFILGPTSAWRWCSASANQLLERYITAYGAEGRLQYTIFRPFNLIGSRMDFMPGIDGEGVQRVFARFMESLLFRKPLPLVDGGRNRRTFTAIQDATEAVVQIIERPQAALNQIFNIGNPSNEITIAELAERMINLYTSLRPGLTGVQFVTKNVSARDFYGEGYQDSDRRLPDIGRANRQLQWYPAMGLTETLQQAMEAFISDYSGGRSVG